MHREAVEHQLHFYQTRAGVQRAVERERLVPLSSGSDYTLHQVSFPYVKAATRMFAERLGAQYRDACGETLVVTGAVRVTRRQPSNASDQSVHPTGIALDLRKPTATRCRTWLRSTLLELEGDGVIEATEEYSPPHFHVVVFRDEYARHVARLTRRAAASTSRTAARRTHTVRRGDSLWGIAERYHTTVPRLKAANGLNNSTVRPGQVLMVPGVS
jgi:hypothetical protein